MDPYFQFTMFIHQVSHANIQQFLEFTHKSEPHTEIKCLTNIEFQICLLINKKYLFK